jgi:hypothetical protein
VSKIWDCGRKICRMMQPMGKSKLGVCKWAIAWLISDEKELSGEGFKKQRAKGTKLVAREGGGEKEWKDGITGVEVKDGAKFVDKDIVIGKSLMEGVVGGKRVKSTDGEDKRSVQAGEEMRRYSV